MQENKVGHLIVIEKNMSNIVSVVSKKDFLLFMIRNFTMNFIDDKLLDMPILKVSIGVSGDNIFQMRDSCHLREIFQYMLNKKLSCVPIMDNEGKCVWILQKYQVYLIFENLAFEFVS